MTTVSQWLLILLTAAYVHLARAQELAKVPQIGYLSAGCDRSSTEALQQGLRGLGYIEGKNIAIQYRNADGKFNQLLDLAADLVRLKVDVIVAPGDAAINAVRKSTTTIPILMLLSHDPVMVGHVASRPMKGESYEQQSNFIRDRF